MARGKVTNRKELSASELNRLECEPDKPFTEYFDSKTTGFGARVMASGKKVYFVKCRVKGRTTAAGTPLQIKMNLGKVTEKVDPTGRRRPDPEQFNAMYAEARRIIEDAGKGITPEDRESEKEAGRKEQERLTKLEAAKDFTFRKLLERYIGARTKKGRLKPSTGEQYKLSLETHCADWLDIPARDITKTMIEERHLAIAERHTVKVRSGEKIRGGNLRIRGGKGTADATMRVVRAVLNYGVSKDDIGALTFNPADTLKGEWFKLGRRDSSITTDQLKAWFAGLEAVENPAIKLMMEISLFTGARKNEVASLLWSDVDLDADTPYAVFRETKNGKQLLIPLAAHVVRLMQGYKKVAFSGPDGFLFPSWGKSGHIKDPRRQIKKAVAAGGVAFMPHDSRRSFLSFCNHDDLRIQTWTQKRLCNHSLPQDVTEGYVQHELKSLQATIERVAAFILKHAGLLDGSPATVAATPAEPATVTATRPDNVSSLEEQRRKKKAA
jgi:integrase